MKEEVGLPFIARMIPRYVTRERIEILKAGGLEYVTMGLEASDRVNRTVFSRHESAESFAKAARIVLEAGLRLSIDVLRDNPYERESDLRDLATTLNSLPRPNWGIVALPLTAFPNTPLFARAARDRMLERFATDSYDSMLVPSREGEYRTPEFWKLLITVVLPRVNPTLGEWLIGLGPLRTRRQPGPSRNWRGRSGLPSRPRTGCGTICPGSTEGSITSCGRFAAAKRASGP